MPNPSERMTTSPCLENLELAAIVDGSVAASRLALSVLELDETRANVAADLGEWVTRRRKDAR